MILKGEFSQRMETDGFFLFPHIVPLPLITEMKNDLERCYVECNKLQVEKGIQDITEGTVHHLTHQAQSFLRYLSVFSELDEYVKYYFGGNYILNSFGGNILKKGSSYANNIHRDIRSYSGAMPLMLNTIVMLDEFAEANGATWLMKGGHKLEKKPTEQIFKAFAEQIVGPPGSVLFFNSNLWHAAGENRTERPRRSVTPMFSKCFYKPQFDYCQHDPDKYTPYLQQVLGYNSRIPETLSEWYAKPEDRMYKPDQG